MNFIAEHILSNKLYPVVSYSSIFSSKKKNVKGIKINANIIQIKYKNNIKFLKISLSIFTCDIFDKSFGFDIKTSKGINNTEIKDSKIDKIKIKLDKGESSSEST